MLDGLVVTEGLLQIFEHGKLYQLIPEMRRWLVQWGLGWLWFPNWNSPFVYTFSQILNNGLGFACNFVSKEFLIEAIDIFLFAIKLEAKFHSLSSERSDTYFQTIWDRTDKLCQKVIPRGFKVGKKIVLRGKKYMVIQVGYFPYYIRKSTYNKCLLPISSSHITKIVLSKASNSKMKEIWKTLLQATVY